MLIFLLTGNGILACCMNYVAWGSVLCLVSLPSTHPNPTCAHACTHTYTNKKREKLKKDMHKDAYSLPPHKNLHRKKKKKKSEHGLPNIGIF